MLLARRPTGADFNMPVISSFSLYSLGQGRIATGQTAPASITWPTSIILYLPLQIPEPFTIQQFFWYSGATSAGNVDVGVYSWANTGPVTKLASIGPTPQGTVSVITSAVATAVTTIPAGRYYFGVTFTDATATVISTSTVLLKRADGVMQEAGTALPATATPVVLSGGGNGLMPYVGMTSKTVL